MNAPQRDTEAPRLFESAKAYAYRRGLRTRPWPSPRETYAKRVLLILAAVMPEALHDLFHFADWLAWGVGLVPNPLESVRELLFPLFGAHTTAGYIAHAFVNSWTLAWLVAMVYLYGRRRWPS